MMTNVFDLNRRTLICLAVGASLPLLAFALLGTIGLNLADESYLWYGAQRVMAGEVPIRDFEAYDLPRYYWAAGIMSLAGSKGILALRLSNAILLSAAMAIALYLVAKSTRQGRVGKMLIAACIFLLWMTPDYKVADFFSCCILIFGLAFLIEAPTLQRYFLCGIIVGIAAMLGRNHGLYGLIGSLSTIAYLKVRRDGPPVTRALCAWGAGVLLGYLPMLIALALIPGFFAAFVDGIRSMFESGSTNVTLPLHRPWWVPFPHFAITGSWPDDLTYVRRFLESVGRVLGDSLLLSLPFVAIASMAYLFVKRPATNPVFAACVFLMLPYSHYAWSRADVVHLAFGILPFLIGIVTFPSMPSVRIQKRVLVLLLLSTILIILPQNPTYNTLTGGGAQKVTVAGDQLLVQRNVAQDLALLNGLAQHYAPNGRLFLSVPFPGPYAVLERKSPIWEIYDFGPQKEPLQNAEIANIKKANIGFAVISTYMVDNRRDFLYSVSHADIDRYVVNNFRYLTTGDGLFKLRAFAAAK